MQGWNYTKIHNFQSYLEYEFEEMNLDTAIFAQIQPILLESRKLDLDDESGKELVGELYFSMYDFYNKDLKKFKSQIEHIEKLKVGKEFEIIDNLINQQKDIVDKSEEKKNKILCDTYNKWVDKYMEKKNVSIG